MQMKFKKWDQVLYFYANILLALFIIIIKLFILFHKLVNMAFVRKKKKR